MCCWNFSGQPCISCFLTSSFLKSEYAIQNSLSWEHRTEVTMALGRYTNWEGIFFETAVVHFHGRLLSVTDGRYLGVMMLGLL